MQTLTEPNLRVGGLVAFFAAAISGLIGCASNQVSDLDAFRSVEMNRVVPYPSEEELRERAFEIIFVDLEPATSADSAPRDRRIWLRRKLIEMTGNAGAIVVVNEESNFTESGVGGAVRGSTNADNHVDYIVGVGLVTYKDTATWQPPFRFLWQTPEEVADREGTCVHRAEVEFDIEVVEAFGHQSLFARHSLSHFAESKIKAFDKSCPIPQAALDVLFDGVMTDSLSCLRAPIDRMFAPRGHVMAHIMAPETDRHLFRISLGSAQGIELGHQIEIRREQHASTPKGEARRTERVIATGIVTEHIREQDSWAAIDPTRATEGILEGDVVRPVLKEGLLSSLSGPNCGKILVKR